MLPRNQVFFRPYEASTITKSVTFTPYQSDSESDISDSSSDSGSTSSWEEENLPNFAQFATNMQLVSAAGPTMSNFITQTDFGIDTVNKNVGYASIARAFNIELPFNGNAYDLSGKDIFKADAPPTQSITSIIMLNSRDRDRNVYPQPTQLTLRLPRVYNNITSLQVVQMKLLSSFLYFRPDKANLSLLINEFGRINYNYLGTALGQLNVLNNIRSGTYNINTLISELTTQLNTPPIFYDYPGGFNQFVTLFASTGDLNINFNYPGDYFYDSLNGVFTSAPTRTYITTRYWQSTTLGFTPTLKQSKVAYYYPVLKEYVIDPDYGMTDLVIAGVDLSGLLPQETIYSRIVYTFQGVSDTVIQQLIDVNVTALDQYRSAHSFRQTLINKYSISYDTFNNRIFFQSPSLNTSLVNLLNTQYAIFFQQQLSAYSLTSNTYLQLQSLNSQILSIINSMYDYIQTQLAISFGINFNTYAPVYFTQPNNYLNIQNALNAIGVSSNYDFAVVTSGRNAISSNVIETNRKDPLYLWPNMSNLPTDPTLGTLGYPINLGASNVAPFQGGSNYPYVITSDNFDFSQPFIDSTGDVAIDLRRKAGDILCPIEASKYTVFKFRSLYRQTLQVETLPRPTQYRYPAFNTINYDSNIATFYDNSYSFVFNANNSKMDNVPFSNIKRIYGFSNADVAQATDFGIDFDTSLSLWGSNYLSLDVRNSVNNFVIFLPIPQGAPVAPAYKHKMALTIVNDISSNPIPAGLDMFLYQDRAAFMADLSGNARQEKTIHYKTASSFKIGDLSGTLTWNAYAGQTYYIVLRSTEISFQSFQAKLVVWYPDGSNYTSLTNTLQDFNPYANPLDGSNLTNFNYANQYDPDYVKLPIGSNLWGYNPAGNEVNLGLEISNVPIGYDKNDVSTDLTDYVGFTPGVYTDNINPTSLIRVDPISRYFFQVGGPYSLASQSYFYTGANNYLLSPNNQSNYTATTVDHRQYKIVHWYDTTYIPDPVGSVTTYNPATDLSPYIPPYNLAATNNVPLSNYKYDLSSNNIQLGLGCCGFTFAPTDGIWTVDRIMFRSAMTTNDLNSNIAYLGIFLTNQANGTPSFRLSLTNAVGKLKFNKKTTYQTSGDVQFGFDSYLGTYYDFISDTTFPQQNLTGFAQNPEIFFNNPNNFYSVIPFDANSNIIFIKALTGSLTPYPYICDASASRFYFDGGAAPSRTGIVMPKPPSVQNSPYGPPTGTSYTLSAYEQSIPIGTTILHYLSRTDLAVDLSGFNAWKGINYAPTQIYADVSGLMMVQGSGFTFYSYPYNSRVRTFTEQVSLTVDDIYPEEENTFYMGAAGNSTVYAFLGFQSTGSAFQVRIKIYDPAQGQIFDIFVPSQFQIPDLGFSVKTFSFNDSQGFVISGTSGTGVAKTYRTPRLSAGSFFVDTYPLASMVSVKSVQISSRSIVYSQVYNSSGTSPMYFYGVDQDSDMTGRNVYTINPGTDIPSTYTNFTATYIQGEGDELVFLSDEYPSYFFKMEQLVLSSPGNYSATLSISLLRFQDSVGNYVSPINLVPGAIGGIWTLLSTAPYVLGNRNDGEDAPIRIQNAWQMFYPTSKIVLKKLANAVNPITDLSGLQYPEFPHTEMFVYNTKAAFVNDISNNTSPKWGLESSGGLMPTNIYNLNSNGFLVSDTKFSGYNFNSYIFNVPLLPNTGANPEPNYYLAVRNYTPSEKSQVLLRFNMPQRYDFGFVRIRDLSNEPLFAVSNGTEFNPTYYTALLDFDSKFAFSNRNFGYNPTQNISGKDITSTGFGDFINQYTTLYGLYSSNSGTITNITNTVNSNMFSFIGSNLSYILPDYAKTRQAFTDPITFSILFKTALTPTFLAAEDEWGLGWNLGFDKADTNYATIQRAQSFFKILDDYIYLKLSQEYDMNRMDFGAKENLAATKEPQGTIRGYNGKLLLNTFGNFAQTIIQNPVYFNPPLLKLDKLSFTWFDVNNQTLNNTECEWNAAIQIVEETLVPSVKGKNPVIIPQR